MSITNTADVNSPKPRTDKAGHVYKSQAEKMKYYMRRLRNSSLPHYPEHEPKEEQEKAA